MTPKELWQTFIVAHPVHKKETYRIFSYGNFQSRTLFELTQSGLKTAHSSLYCLYELEEIDLPEINQWTILLNEDGQASCILKTNCVKISPFIDVNSAHAKNECLGDATLTSWRKIQMAFFKEQLRKYHLSFDHDMLIVLEEFEVFYKG